MNRKQFLHAAGLGLLAGCAGDRSQGGAESGGDPSDPSTTAAPPLDRIGLQLYTVRSMMAEDVRATLELVAAIGYREVEFAGYFGHDPATLRGWLDGLGLTAPAAHVGLDELTPPQIGDTIEAAAVLGHRWLVLPWIGEEFRTADGYRRLADSLNEAGDTARGAEMRVAYHNHAFEFDTVDDGGDPRTGYDVLARSLDPALVDLEIDFHWSAAAGVDPMELIAAHPGRFALCHLKDIDAQGRMADVGAGEIDWPAIFARSEEAGLRHYLVEHDNPADPAASIRASHDYLAALPVR